MLKILINAVVCIATMVAVAAPVSSYAAAPTKRLALVIGPTENNYIGSWAKHFVQDAAAKGMKVDVFASPFNPALQAQQIDDAVAQKYDLILVESMNQLAVIPPLMRAKAAKVPVFMIISELTGDKFSNLYVSYVGENSTKLGELAGEALGNALMASGRPNAKIAAIVGSMAEGVAPLRMAGFRSALAKYPGMKIVAIDDAQWDPAVAERETGQVLARFSAQGGIDAIYGMNDAMANGVIQGVSAAGMKLGNGKNDVTVVGGNCMAVGIKNLEAGKMAATVSMVPAEEASIAVARAQDFFAGKPIPKRNYVDHQIINRENVAKFASACSY